jgi:uncharacterized DUF497 family protein
MKIEWDESKNRYNKLKHGVPFEEAATVFDDERIMINVLRYFWRN